MKDVFSIIEAVNKRLMDKESKEIYANKIMFNITNDYTYLRNIFEIVNIDFGNMQGYILYFCSIKDIYI